MSDKAIEISVRLIAILVPAAVFTLKIMGVIHWHWLWVVLSIFFGPTVAILLLLIFIIKQQ